MFTPRTAQVVLSATLLGAVLGSDPDDPRGQSWNKVTLEFEVPASGTYRINGRNVSASPARSTFYGSGRYVRNPMPTR